MIDRTNDEPVTNIKTFLLADPSPEAKSRTQQWFVAFTNFLQDHDLTVRTLLKKGQVPDESFEIWESDLTQEGVKLVDKAFERWLTALDRGTSSDDVTVLEKALAAMRKK